MSTTERGLWPVPASPTVTRDERPLDHVDGGSTMPVGDLPHRHAGRATDFVLARFDVASIPQLPAVADGTLLTQAFGDLPGVRVDGGRLHVDPARLDPSAPPDVDLSAPAFGGFATTLARIGADPTFAAPLKWQFLGPISGGVALIAAGVDPIDALEISNVTIRRKLGAIAAAIDAAVPSAHQICVLDEPHVSAVARRSFPLAIDESIDVLSCAMATVQQVASVGIHTCANLDVGVLVEAGPELLSLPVRGSVVRGASHLDRFLRAGGLIAWGAVSTTGPVGVTARRSVQGLLQLWADLVRHGCDPDLLCRRSIVTPACGLGAHSPSGADRIGRTVGQVASVVRGDAARSMITFGRRPGG